MLIAVIVVGVGVLFWLISRAVAQARAVRQQRFQDMAARLGLDYLGDNYFSEPAGCLASAFTNANSVADEFLGKFDSFSPFGVGDSKNVSDLLIGRRKDTDFYCFTYTFMEGSGKSRHQCSYGIVAARLPYIFEKVQIRPESFADRVGALFGLHDVQFESATFNKKFHVTAVSPKFAYDLISQEMMDYLLGIRPWAIQLDGWYILIVEPGQLDPDTLALEVQDIEGFVNHIPAYVKQDIGFQPTWTSPLS